MQSITQFTETVVIGLEQDKGIAHRCEGIKRLGIRAELGQDDISRYVDAVFCFANERNRNQHAMYSVSLNSNNKVLRTIYRKRFTLPQRRGGRNAGSASGNNR